MNSGILGGILQHVWLMLTFRHDLTGMPKKIGVAFWVLAFLFALSTGAFDSIAAAVWTFAFCGGIYLFIRLLHDTEIAVTLLSFSFFSLAVINALYRVTASTGRVYFPEGVWELSFMVLGLAVIFISQVKYFTRVRRMKKNQGAK